MVDLIRFNQSCLGMDILLCAPTILKGKYLLLMHWERLNGNILADIAMTYGLCQAATCYSIPEMG